MCHVKVCITGGGRLLAEGVCVLGFGVKYLMFFFCNNCLARFFCCWPFCCLVLVPRLSSVVNGSEIFLCVCCGVGGSSSVFFYLGV